MAKRIIKQPELQLFRSLWGLERYMVAPQELFHRLKAEGYVGIEASLPDLGRTRRDRTKLTRILHDSGMKLIVGVYSSWQDYGNVRKDHYKPASHHLGQLQDQLREAMELGACHINTHAGCDVWEETTQVLPFFEQVLTMQHRVLDDFCPIRVSHETHRGRPFGNPFLTDRILSKLPELRLTADISHWVISCERLLGGPHSPCQSIKEEESELLKRIAEKTIHVHARVGNSQAPQVADLRDEHQKASIESHMRFWKEVQHAHRNRQEKYLRMTPELGPAPYTPTFPHSGEPVTDVTEMINYASGELRRVFGSTDLSFPPSTSSPP